MGQSGQAETPGAAVAPLCVVAVVAAEMTAPQLWALRALVAYAHGVRVVRAAAPPAPPSRRGSALAAAVAERELRRQDARMERLFAGAELRAWFAGAGIVAADVPALDHGEAREAVARLAPDVLISPAGLEPVRHLAALARRAALGVALAGAAARVERQTIVRGIVEGRLECIGASVYALEAGGATPRLVWRARPQLAPGDSGDEVVFRACVEAVTGLLGVLDSYAQGARPASAEDDGAGAASAPGLWTWLRYVASGRGRTARPACERALRC